jgi:membrane fusion protein, multidrug efflux system
MKNAYFLLFSLSTFLLLTGCHKSEVAEKKPTPVAVFRIANDQSQPSQQYTGQVQARYEINAAFRVGGKVVQRLVEVGQQVPAGTILAKLDTVDYQLAVEAAENELQSAQATERRAVADDGRTRDLIERSVVSQAESDLVKATAESAIAARNRAERMLELAKNRLDYCTLVAEFDSVVTRVMCEEGSVVQEGSPVFQLARADELEAVFNIPENRIESVKDLSAKISLWANSEQSFDGKIREISPTADPATRTYQARYSIAQPTENVRIGMTATVQLESSDKNCGTFVPLTAIVTDNGSAAVFVVDSNNGSLSLRPVQIKLYGQDKVLIESTLEPGDLIVRAGVQKLDPSMQVAVWEDRVASSN